jgi:hypothetical protein
MKTVTVSENGEIPIEAFAEFTDITKVKYYSFELLPDNTLKLSLYDSKKRLIKIGKKNEK